LDIDPKEERLVLGSTGPALYIYDLTGDESIKDASLQGGKERQLKKVLTNFLLLVALPIKATNNEEESIGTKRKAPSDDLNGMHNV